MNDRPFDGMLSLAAPMKLEIDKIKGSRFIGYAWPVGSMEDMQLRLEEVQREHPTARHLCYGWRGSDADQHRHSDAGEPRGSSGPPILRAIEGAELFEVGVVVVRYFGGTKLGVGGLIRAYGACARAVLDAAPKEERRRTTRLLLRFAPSAIGAVNGCLLSRGIKPGAPRFSDSVELEVVVPEAEVTPLKAALMDACAGKIEYES
jgi:uncharacterized YigZ family protein